MWAVDFESGPAYLVKKRVKRVLHSRESIHSLILIVWEKENVVEKDFSRTLKHWTLKKIVLLKSTFTFIPILKCFLKCRF